MIDFILFENYISARNHYKDICIIARMLKACGYSVAIADVFNEDEYCDVEGVEHIVFPESWHEVPNTETMPELKKFAVNKINKSRYNKRLSYCVDYLRDKCCNIYAGSYYTGMPMGWMKHIPADVNVFFWGLRSARLIEYKIKPFTLAGINSYFLHQYAIRHKNLKFFVSDEIIRKEFLNLGIEPERLVLRPERMIDELPGDKLEIDYSGLKLLSIGAIRPAKRIEKILEAIRLLNDSELEYTIAGKAQSSNLDYENVIAEASVCMANVKRLNYRIPEDEYNELMDSADFLILCDEKQPSSVTNGTMNEALLKGVPLIAPDYNPYKYFIEKYNIGILFNPEDKTSLTSAISRAKKMGKDIFKDNIRVYQKTLLFDTVVENFHKELKRTIV